jgi:MFS family permease
MSCLLCFAWASFSTHSTQRPCSLRSQPFQKPLASPRAIQFGCLPLIRRPLLRFCSLYVVVGPYSPGLCTDIFRCAQSGRISDVYSPKPVFVLGTAFFGLTTLGGGFTNDKISFLVLRALQGIGASLTIPSSLSLIVQMFPDPQEQSRAIGWYGSIGAIGNGKHLGENMLEQYAEMSAVLGTIIGALLVQYTSWRWIFWMIALIAVPISILCIVLIPKTPKKSGNKKAKFDFVGVFALTCELYGLL